MHGYFLPMCAAFACALCNGTASVLQKISADKENHVRSLNAKFMWRLLQDKPYTIGILLDVLGWIFTLYAVQYLPLFLVGAIIAASIVVTALIERIVRRQPISVKSYRAITIIILGLVLLAFASTPDRSLPVSTLFKSLVIVSIVPIGIAGYILTRRRSYMATIGLGIVSGVAFGGTSILGRIIRLPHPLWHSVYSPLILATIVSGILGMLLFSIALQRSRATITMATMNASETLVPAVIGIAFLGDSARNGMWYLVIFGITLTLSGVALLTFEQVPEGL